MSAGTLYFYLYMNLSSILTELKSLGNPEDVEGMARFGINKETALGIRIPVLRDLAKKTKKNHPLALELWKTNIHEARLLAIFIADPKLVDEALMENWLKDFNSWDICDQACGNLFDKHPLAFEKAKEWAGRDQEFEKRAGFTMMATLAVHAKKADDLQFINFFPLIEKHANDNRNFVKKAVNWALRQIGKKNNTLKILAIETAERIREQNTASARWIAADALRELNKQK